jgi:hypothetical protein
VISKLISRGTLRMNKQMIFRGFVSSSVKWSVQ